MQTSPFQPFQLMPLYRERVWGRTSLAPLFPQAPVTENAIGEVWLTSEDNDTSTGLRLGEAIKAHPEMLGNAGNAEHPGLCPLLVKFLFTTSRLSVQVHPDDAYAKERHQCLGKTEAWYVVDAAPPAEVAVGFVEPLSPERLQESALSGEIERLLDWRTVAAGDSIFVPAGTVHAIGAGLTICEIQQNSDITYRLYDYGRPRELHLEDGRGVSDLGRYRHETKPAAITSWRDHLVDCPYFRMERLRPQGRVLFSAAPYYLLLICTSGSGSIAGQRCAAGDAWFVPAGASEFAIEGAGAEWILAYKSDATADTLRGEYLS